MKKKLAIVFAILVLLVVPSYAVREGTNKTIKLNTTIKDYLDTYDEVDYFSFDLNKAGSLKIDFDFDVKSRYTVKLLNLDTNKVTESQIKIAFREQAKKYHPDINHKSHK